MKPKPLVYVAGPYTHPDPVQNTNAAIHFATNLYETKLVVPIIPHLSLLWHLVCPRPYEFWTTYDLEIMRTCDAVFRMPGESAGADTEVAEATVPVFTDRQALLDWANRWKFAA